MSNSGPNFRALHHQDMAFIMPNPWDRGTAIILERLGFEALATTSAGMAFNLGLADGAVPREAVLAHCREIVEATTLPVSADLEQGFGDSPESAHATIIAAAETGLAGCSLEDHTGDPDNPIYEKSLAVERIGAAVEAARGLDRDFVLTARCENLLWGRPDLDDVIDRLQAYEVAGADVLYAPWIKSMEDIARVCAALSKPVNVVIEGPGADFTLEGLSQAGVKRISIGARLAQLAYGSLITAAREMAEKGSFAFTKNAMDHDEVEAFFK